MKSSVELEDVVQQPIEIRAGGWGKNGERRDQKIRISILEVKHPSNRQSREGRELGLEECTQVPRSEGHEPPDEKNQVSSQYNTWKQNHPSHLTDMPEH